MLLCAPLPPLSPVKLSMPVFEEEGREVIPTFALLMNFFSPLTEEACYPSRQTWWRATLQSFIQAEGEESAVD